MTDSKTTESGFGIAIRSFTYSTNPPTSKTHTHTRKEKKKGPKTHHTHTTEHYDIRAGSYVRCLPVGRTDLPRRSDRAARPRTVLPPPAGSALGIGGRWSSESRLGQWRPGHAWDAVLRTIDRTTSSGSCCPSQQQHMQSTTAEELVSSQLVKPELPGQCACPL